MSDKEVQEGWNRRIRIRAALEEQLKAWAKVWGEPGALPVAAFLVEGVEYAAVKSIPMGNGFSYYFKYEDAQVIPVHVRIPRPKVKRARGPRPEDAE